ncbi:PAS domain-containing protein [Sphingomonas xanthus]|uniref:PAS domain S-box protein n=1 Tax=Sphingomonas xanthus TaxID=2594473 RepID=A0A516INX7_9SPHN|nr:PAS domain-containing protein [Sphingomonas xanthus]QDP18589.1 PAS domain S-box protein [Sphingomonas xanthus]
MSAADEIASLYDRVIAALQGEAVDCQEAIDSLPYPAYMTDADGVLRYWNKACADFAGRTPATGRDQWCVTWRLHTVADDHLPHDSCPMAVALKERREVRGEIAIALRPDGRRRAFQPYPTPLYDANGKLIGGINMLVDVSEEQIPALAAQASHYRKVADAISDREAAAMIRRMADGCDRNAEALAAANA